MLEMKEMSRDEEGALLARAPYGHLGCARDGHPYVVPMNYAYEAGDIYFFTTEGTKTEFISANGEVCFQVEEVSDALNWQSVMATGRAGRLSAPAELERAMRLIASRHPTLAPALNRTKIGPWTRLGHIAGYRIRPGAGHGRPTRREGKEARRT